MQNVFNCKTRRVYFRFDDRLDVCNIWWVFLLIGSRELVYVGRR